MLLISVIVFIFFCCIFAAGIWGLVMSVYSEFEAAAISPLLQLIADQKLKLVWLFIPLYIISLALSRAINYIPLWIGIYLLMLAFGYPSETIYSFIGGLILISGMLKAGSTRNPYYDTNSCGSYVY